VAADGAERIQHLAAEEQTGVTPALERTRIHLAERDAAAGNLGLLVAFVAGPGQGERGQRLE
jgi:hypothetical protein